MELQELKEKLEKSENVEETLLEFIDEANQDHFDNEELINFLRENYLETLTKINEGLINDEETSESESTEE
jgi:transcription elongation factor GreA-like protein